MDTSRSFSTSAGGRKTQNNLEVQAKRRDIINRAWLGSPSKRDVRRYRRGTTNEVHAKLFHKNKVRVAGGSKYGLDTVHTLSKANAIRQKRNAAKSSDSFASETCVHSVQLKATVGRVMVLTLKTRNIR